MNDRIDGGYKPMKMKIIACNVLYREVCYAAATSKNKIDFEFLPKGLHDLETEEMLKEVQKTVDRSSKEDYDYVLMAYALCNNGTVGLKARSVPVVIPRAHDCITLFLGSGEKYNDYFDKNPGTYFHTTGWLERSDSSEEIVSQSIGHKTGMDKSYEELVKEYGEDNAKYLYETLCDTTRNYSRLAFIESGLEADGRFEDYSRAQAEKNGWDFEKIKGNTSLLEKLANGDWDEKEFLIIPPGSEIACSYDDLIIRAKASD